MKRTPLEHIYRIYAPYPLHFAVMSKQLEEKLTKSKALLLFALKGAHMEGRIPDAEYEMLKARYSVSIPEAQAEKQVLTPEQILQEQKKSNKYKLLNRQFEQIVERWDSLKIAQKEYWVKKAEENSNLKYAKKVLELAEQWREACMT